MLRESHLHSQPRHFSLGLAIVTLMCVHSTNTRQCVRIAFLPNGKVLRLRLQCICCATCKRVVANAYLARAQVYTPEIIIFHKTIVCDA